MTNGTHILTAAQAKDTILKRLNFSRTVTTGQKDLRGVWQAHVSQG